MVHFIPPSQRRLAILAAQADPAPVLIDGASGTGKGAIARWIHATGPRAAKPLHVAVRATPLAQQIREAQGGSLIIPEIGEWTRAEQKILVDYLQKKTVPHPQDVNMQVLVNTRIIATTSQSLENRAEAGLFNADLMKKLNTFRLSMPNLTDRREEFDDIAGGILAEIAREVHKEHLLSLTPEAMDVLRGYHWPANLRELRNVLRVAAIRATGSRILKTDLPEFGQDRVDFHATREEFEKNYLLDLLKNCDWQIDRACEENKLDRTAFEAKLKKYGIDTTLSPSML